MGGAVVTVNDNLIRFSSFLHRCSVDPFVFGSEGGEKKGAGTEQLPF